MFIWVGKMLVHFSTILSYCHYLGEPPNQSTSAYWSGVDIIQWESWTWPKKYWPQKKWMSPLNTRNDLFSVGQRNPTFEPKPCERSCVSHQQWWCDCFVLVCFDDSMTTCIFLLYEYQLHHTIYAYTIHIYIYIYIFIYIYIYIHM